jgi:two-component system chemotaxis response regulator CheB
MLSLKRKAEEIMPNHDIIVIGCSAGGISALRTLVGLLPTKIPAAIFVVQHISPHSSSQMPSILQRAGTLPTSSPKDKTSIEMGHIYVAPPDIHMLLEPGIIRIVRGPKENRSRPAIDPLFRSAALAYGSRVIGVILTGALDDGTAGLWAIKERGGIALVQDPAEATYPSMPNSAIAHVVVDYVGPVASIVAKIVQLVATPTIANVAPAPAGLEHETKIAAMELLPRANEVLPGLPSVYSCPNCGGVLWELQDGGNLLRFRCRVGHAFTAESVLAEQDDTVEQALWVALKTLEESASLLRQMAERAQQNGHSWLQSRLEELLSQKERNAAVLRHVLEDSHIKVLGDEPIDIVPHSEGTREIETTSGN